MRKSKRKQNLLKHCKFFVKGEIPRADYGGTIRDLSVGGLGLVTNKTLDLGEELNIEFAFAYRDVTVIGKVVNAHDGKYGIQFTNVSDEDRELIELVVVP